MGNADISSYKTLFIKSAREHCEAISQHLAALKNEPNERIAITEVYRHAHSLKGQCMMMGFKHTAKVSGVLEALFAGVKEGPRHATEELLDVSEQYITKLKSSLEMIERQGKELDFMKEEQVDSLNSIKNTI